MLAFNTSNITKKIDIKAFRALNRRGVFVFSFKKTYLSKTGMIMSSTISQGEQAPKSLGTAGL